MLIIDYVLKSWRNYKIRMKNLDIKLGANFVLPMNPTGK